MAIDLWRIELTSSASHRAPNSARWQDPPRERAKHTDRDYTRTVGKGTWLTRVPFHDDRAARNEPVHKVMQRVVDRLGIDFVLGGYRTDDHELVAVLVRDRTGWWIHLNRTTRVTPKRLCDAGDDLATATRKANAKLRGLGWKVPR